MKKLIILIFILTPICLKAEFFNKNFSGQAIPSATIADSFPVWFDIGESYFILQNEEHDSHGNFHQYYQQYLNNVIIENCVLAIHSCSGIVKSINGDIMLAQSTPKQTRNISSKKAKRIIGRRAISNSESIIVHNNQNGLDEFHMAYKLRTNDSILYVDAQTGAIIKSLPTRYGFTICNGNTEYSGSQNFPCEINSTSEDYILYDQQRNIATMYANIDKCMNGEESLTFYSNSSTNWENRYLTSITLEGFGSTWWRGLFDNEQYPQIYIAIYDSNDNLLYRSDIKDFSITSYYQCPVKFNISKMIIVPANGGLKVKIYDWDSKLNDLGQTVTISNNTLGDHPWGTSSSNVWGKMTITDWHPALDIYWGEIQVYNYYLSVWGRNSFDNNGTLLRSMMHNPTTKLQREYEKNLYYNNAFAQPGASPAESFMVFGIGDEYYGFRVGLNTIAHEYTHLISAFRPMGELEYKGESGALNESMSDIMAKNIEHHYKPNTFSWQYGKDHMPQGQCTRDFQNPYLGRNPQPSCYEGGAWVDPSSEMDNGGVHYNSGVANHWYYLLCEGGNGYNDLGEEYSVQAIGIDTAEQVIFNTLLYYLPPQATFKQARQLTIQVAQDLYSSNPNVALSIANAWGAVGVYDTIVNRQQYGILVNGLMEHYASRMVNQDYQGRDQYVVRGIYLQAGDFFECLDITNEVTWIIDTIDQYGAYQNFNATPRGMECLVSGCYSIYLKLAYEDDVIYIEEGENCEEPEFVFYEGKYVIVANRDYDEWYYMTADLGTSSNKRYQAVYAGNDYDSISYSNLDDKYVWELVKDGNKWKLKNGNSFSVWISGNTANFNSTGMQITLSAIYDKTAFIHFYDGTNERYLSLNKSEGNNYFAYYRERNQIPYLYFIPYIDEIVEDSVISCKSLPYSESFATSLGNFTIQEVSKDDGLSYVWKLDESSYQNGMVAKAMYSNVYYASEGWLISPCIDIPENAITTLTFDHTAKFFCNADEEMTLWLSTDYESGLPSTATWNKLTIPTYPSGTNWSFVSSNNIDLTAYAGSSITIAFRYISTNTSAAQWEIKNVSILCSPNPSLVLGDVNKDGIVNVMDATALIGAYLKGTTSTLAPEVADVNHDGVINVMDATEIINIYLHNR